MKNTKIEWADHTFNPWIGCTKVSPGCAHCYAETRSKRTDGIVWGKGQRRRRTSAENWKQPRRWNAEAEASGSRPRVFCASLGDVFDEEVGDSWRDDLFELIHQCKNLDWLILTKRPEIMAEYLVGTSGMGASNLEPGGPWDHLWLGTSAENQDWWDKRVPVLLELPATVRFVSAEPLLGPITMGDHRPDWLIVGGESGPRSRFPDYSWVQSLRDQCDHRTAFFFKQWGGVKKALAGRGLDGRTHDAIPAPSLMPR